MSGKNNSQSSQSNFNPHSVEHGEQIMDFLVTLKDWENDECRTMLSRTLETEKDFDISDYIIDSIQFISFIVNIENK